MNTLPPPVVAQSVMVPGPDGKPRIIIGLGDDGQAAIRLLDDDGRERACLGVLSFTGTTGSSSGAELRLTSSDDGPEIGLLATRGNASVELVCGGDEAFANACMGVTEEGDRREVRLVLGDKQAAWRVDIEGGQVRQGSGADNP